VPFTVEVMLPEGAYMVISQVVTLAVDALESVGA